MATIQIESTAPPFDDPRAAVAAFRLLQTAEAMGLYRPARPVRRLDLPALRDVVKAVQRGGIGRGAHWALEDDPSPAELPGRIEQLARALEESPSPDTEWRRLAEVLGPEVLAPLAGVSPSSLARYQAGERATPDDVADRVHLLALVVGDLAGAYNDVGIRRWFERPRTALGGRRPADLLSGSWRPDDDGPRRVKALAHALVSSPAT
jgi:hypothetical protein